MTKQRTHTTRRRYLQVIAATTTGATTLKHFPRARAASTESYSFERATAGSGSPADPWYVFNDGGTHEVRTDHASEGDQSFFTGGASLGDPSAIAIDLDLTPVTDVIFDVYAVSNNPSAGNIKISVDQAGYPTSNDLKIANVHSGITTNGTGTGEGQWNRNLSERDVGTPNIADFEGNHPLIFWVDGDNAVYWDNVRIVKEGEPTETIVQTTKGQDVGTIPIDDGFEDGTLDGWVPVEMPERANDRDGNDWTVTDEDPISGDYSLRLGTAGQWDDNCLATEDFVLDFGRDFTLSFRWRTPDPDNCGPVVTQITQEGTNFESQSSDEVRPENAIWLRYGPDAIDEDGSPFDGEVGFCGSRFSRPSFETSTVHRTEIRKRGTTATLFTDGEEYASATVRDDGTYRLLIGSEGTWGNPSTIYFDDITLSYQDGGGTPTTTEPPGDVGVTKQEGETDDEEDPSNDEDDSSIPVLNRFDDSERTLGVGILIGLLGGGGGYAGYRKLRSGGRGRSQDQRDLYD